MCVCVYIYIYIYILYYIYIIYIIYIHIIYIYIIYIYIYIILFIHTYYIHTYIHTREGIDADVQDTALHAGAFFGSAQRLEVFHKFVDRLLGLTAVRNFAS